jgi:DNA polymerase III delta prime subunit
MWMQGQILNAGFVVLVCTETYLRRVERREKPGKGRGVLWEATLIYNLLYAEDAEVQRFIPVLVADGQPSSIPLPLRGLTHYRVDNTEGYEDLYRHLTNQPRHAVPALGKLRSLPVQEPSSFPASVGAATAQPLTPLDQRRRQQLIKQVHLDWIDGVLEQSLYKVARIELGLADRSDSVEQPLNAVVQVPDRAPREVTPNTPISQIFDEQAGALLILGAPGTGKTTLLLELARDLLLRAEKDESYPIPVVFNLSSWAVRRQPLSEWMVAELNERSYVPKKVGRAWIESEQILPLLDGLDEVAAEHRNACVEAINNFRREHGLLPIAVCSRIADYQALGTKLRLRVALEVQPLTRAQIEKHLQKTGEQPAGLRAAIQGDPSLLDLLETPLMLSVATLAYRDVPQTPQQNVRRRQLFSYFVEAMFRRRSGELRFDRDAATRWLISLARTLTNANQTILYVEDLNFDWLPTWPWQFVARGGLIVAPGLSIGLITGVFAGVNGGLHVGVSVGIFVGLSASLLYGLLAQIARPVQIAVASWKAIRRPSPTLRQRLIESQISGLLVALIAGLIVGNERGRADGLIFGLLFGLIVGVVGVLSPRRDAPETRSTVNEGTNRSLRMALISSPSVALIVGVLVGLQEGLRSGLEMGLSFGLFLGLASGLVCGLLCGGLFVLKHFVLRLFLWQSRSAPLNYVAFLEQAKELLFLRRVGGGYIFSHRLLRDYFASLADSKKKGHGAPAS